MPTRSPSPPPIDDPTYRLIRVAQAMTNPYRLDMLRAMSESGAATLQSLVGRTGLTKATVFQHLVVLEGSGIVERGDPPAGVEPRTGPGRRPTYYRIKGEGVEDVRRMFALFLEGLSGRGTDLLPQGLSVRPRVADAAFRF